MKHYYVNTAPWVGENHEVHEEGCHKMPSQKRDLGLHYNCKTAVAKAQETYPDADGCYYCCEPCHRK